MMILRAKAPGRWRRFALERWRRQASRSGAPEPTEPGKRALTMRNARLVALAMRNIAMRNADAAGSADYAQLSELQHQVLLQTCRRKHGKLRHRPLSDPLSSLSALSPKFGSLSALASESWRRSNLDHRHGPPPLFGFRDPHSPVR